MPESTAAARAQPVSANKTSAMQHAFSIESTFVADEPRAPRCHLTDGAGGGIVPALRGGGGRRRWLGVLCVCGNRRPRGTKRCRGREGREERRVSVPGEEARDGPGILGRADLDALQDEQIALALIGCEARRAHPGDVAGEVDVVDRGLAVLAEWIGKGKNREPEQLDQLL